jgi:hypothetical protein
MGMRLEKGVREGRLAKVWGRIPIEEKAQPQHVAANVGYQPQFQQRPQQPYHQQNQQQPWPQAPPHFSNQNCSQRTPYFDLIPMTYAELLHALIDKNLVHTRAPPSVPGKLSWWHRSNHFCAFHQGAFDNDIEHCWALKYEVQRLIKANTLSYK